MRRNPDVEMLIILAVLIAALILGIYLMAGSGDPKGDHRPYDDKPAKPHFDPDAGK